MVMNKKWVYSFSESLAESINDIPGLLGGKGSVLAEMTKLELPVPPGFTIITEACTSHHKWTAEIKENIRKQVGNNISIIESKLRLKFGDIQNPLLLSVRSGAKISMPGMMDTILNIGLNDQTVLGLANSSGNSRFAYDSYRRFIEMYGHVVMGVESYLFSNILDKYKSLYNVAQDYSLSSEVLKQIIVEYKNIIKEVTNSVLPNDPWEQLWEAINAVFLSWHSSRAFKYRELNQIEHDLGTAVNVQSMVFGNMGENSATGVVFTRNPSDGIKEMFGEFLINAQGEDVVSGVRNVQPISLATKIRYNEINSLSMEEIMPDTYLELANICAKLERHYGDMQDIEFTVQEGKLWILQSRNGKRNINAALQIATDLIDEGVITKERALNNIIATSLDQLLHPSLKEGYNDSIITKGLPASPGAATGSIVMSSQMAELLSKRQKVILVRNETSPEDIGGMSVAQGILTARGGMTSHAAVVARGMGKPCVCGVNKLMIDNEAKKIYIGDLVLNEGDIITINGSTGEVIAGEIPTINPTLPDSFYKVMEIADELRQLDVFANAETEAEVNTAISLGAEGIGLCRTEHMFFNPERLTAVRKMILSDNAEDMDSALSELLIHQEKDFKSIFRIANGLPVNIRLLDPPLHEFLPHGDGEINEFCIATGLKKDKIAHRVKQLTEANPMLGHRGCRLAITAPEIYSMQAKAIFSAVSALIKESIENQSPIIIKPEIMIPLVMSDKEILVCKEIVDDAANYIKGIYGYDLEYKLGTMIELPRAALQADKIAPFVDFISFGTNDLTQTTMGISRDDAGSFLPHYLRKGLIKVDPFVSLDISGVGELMKIAVERSRRVNPKIKIGICGEHGGDPESIKFCQQLGIDYVSCSPFRIPIAKLAAAQAAI